MINNEPPCAASESSRTALPCRLGRATASWRIVVQGALLTDGGNRHRRSIVRFRSFDGNVGHACDAPCRGRCLADHPWPGPVWVLKKMPIAPAVGANCLRARSSLAVMNTAGAGKRPACFASACSIRTLVRSFTQPGYTRQSQSQTKLRLGAVHNSAIARHLTKV